MLYEPGATVNGVPLRYFSSENFPIDLQRGVCVFNLLKFGIYLSGAGVIIDLDL